MPDEVKDDVTEEEQRDIIESALRMWGYSAESWWKNDPDNGGRLKAIVGDAEVVEDDEDHGLYVGDAGKLTCCVVGGREYGNVHAQFYFEADDREGGEQVTPDGSVVELV